MNKEEKLKADLEQNYFRYDHLKDLSKLELIDRVRYFEGLFDQQRDEDTVGCISKITVYIEGNIKHEITFGGAGNDYIEYHPSSVFDIANNFYSIYGYGGDDVDVKVEFKL